MIKKNDLLEALEIVKPALGSKDIIEQTDSFIFKDGCVVTYNDDLSISHPVTGLTFEGAIKAEQMYKMLSKMKKDEVDLEVTESEIVLTAGRSRAGFALQAKITLPLEEVGQAEDWITLPTSFNAIVQKVIGAASRDMSRPVLTAVKFEQSGCTASDGFRLGVAYFDDPVELEEPVLIPATNLAVIMRYNPTEVSVADNWIHFRNEFGTQISSRVLQESFPDIARLLEVSGAEIKFPQTILEILERAAVMGKRDHFLDESVVVSVANNRINIRAESETGWFEEDANMKFSGNPLSFSITPYLFIEVLKETLEAVVGDSRIKFEGENWVYIAILRAS